MPPNSFEGTDQEGSVLWKLTNKHSKCINGAGRSVGDFRKHSSSTKNIKSGGVVERGLCTSCGRKFPGERKLLRRIMKTIGLLIILGILVQETKHLMFPSIPTMLLATEEFIDEPPPPVTTENPPVHIQQIESVEVTSDILNHNGASTAVPDASTSPPPQTGVPVKAAPSNDQSKRKVTKHEVHSNGGSPMKDPIPSQTSTAVPPEEILSNLINAKEENVSIQAKENLTMISSSETDEVLSSDTINQESENVNASVNEFKKEGADEAQKNRVDEDPIPSYMEWAQKKQQELVISGSQNGGQLGGSHGSNGVGGTQQTQAASSNNQSNRSTPAPATVTMNAKNFASPDCGAKVIESNPGTQNPSGVLSSSHDEYMLNKCGIPVWFVVQLCEPLTIETIALGNLELFSSSPKEIEVGISDRYPTRDWTKIGPITLPDARAIHPVVLPSTNSSTFGKYVKVSIISHHGSEHYCPVSVMKVNGKTEYEVLESETGEGDQKPVDFSVDEEQLEEPSSIPLAPEQRSLKDTVLNLINKALQTVVKSGLRLKPSDESDSWMLQSECVSVTQCIPKSELEREIYTLLSCNSSTVLPFLALKSPWCGWDYCHSIFSSNSIGLPWQPEGFYQSIFGGPSVLHALCHYHKPLKDGCSSNSFTLTPNSSLSDSSSSMIDGIGSTEISNKSIPTAPEVVLIDPKEGESPPSGQIPAPVDQPVTDNGEIPLVENVAEPAVEQQIESPHQGGNQQTTNFIVQSQETQIPAPGPIGILSEESQNPSQTNGAPQQQQNQQGQQKESVFVRLTNRIKNLERNQSLTASYLEELSKRFKKHNEETVILNESNRKSVNESKVRIRQLDDFYRQELQSLRRNMEDVREKLFNTQLQRSLLIFMCLGQSIFIVIGCLWARRKLATFETKLSSTLEGFSSDRSSHPLRNSTLSVLGRKRSNSDVTPVSLNQDKPKKLKKKAKKNLQNTQDLTSIDGQQIKTELHPGVTKLGRFTLTPAAFAVNSETVSSASGLGFTPLYPKENLDPKGPILSPPRFVVPTAPPMSCAPSSNNTTAARPNNFGTKVDTPFAFQSTWMSNVDSGVSTSGRFALLASPGGPGSPVRTQNQSVETPSAIDTFKRFGSSNRSSVSSTTSFGGGAGSTAVTSNGYPRKESSGDSSTASSGTNGKKIKKSGLKSLMPKLFDR